tara:strand:- start:536 stop:865 length:330 start_codon:yes stop_codon:yes gene_type:complete
MSTEINNNPERNIRTPYSTAVLVLGIISIPSCVCYGIVGLTTGIIALVLAQKGKKIYESNHTKFTKGSYDNLTAGRVCAIVGVSLSALYFLYFALILGFVFTAANPFSF